MAIIRKHVDNQYTRICNETLRNSELSWEATGMLAYLLSHSDQFKITVSSLAKAKKNGISATRRILGELRSAGYVHFSGSEKGDEGCWAGSVWNIYEIPQGPDCTFLPRVENRTEIDEKHIKTRTPDNGTPDFRTPVFRHALEETIEEETIKNKQEKIFSDESQKEVALAVVVDNSRVSNEWVDVWMDFMGVNPLDVSKREWKEIHKANKEIKEMGGDLDALKLRMAQYSLSKTFSKCERTPNAIMRHWSRLGRAEDVTEYLASQKNYDMLVNQFADLQDSGQ